MGQTRWAGRAGTGFWPPELGSRAPTTWELGANAEVACPGDSRGLALLQEKPLALQCSLVASGGLWWCLGLLHVRVFYTQACWGSFFKGYCSESFNKRKHTFKKTKTKKLLIYLDVCYYLVGLARGQPPWEVSKAGPCSDPGRGSMPGLWKCAPSKALELRQPLGWEPGAVESQWGVNPWVPGCRRTGWGPGPFPQLPLSSSLHPQWSVVPQGRVGGCGDWGTRAPGLVVVSGR